MPEVRKFPKTYPPTLVKISSPISMTRARRCSGDRLLHPVLRLPCFALLTHQRPGTGPWGSHAGDLGVALRAGGGGIGVRDGAAGRADAVQPACRVARHVIG